MITANVTGTGEVDGGRKGGGRGAGGEGQHQDRAKNGKVCSMCMYLVREGGGLVAESVAQYVFGVC